MNALSNTEWSLEDYPAMLARFEAGTEKAKTDLARKLHDELGGFLVAAVMDTAWAEQNLEATEEARTRLKRARKSLAAAVDLKRGMIERLRPTLLDTFGLLAALRWQHKHSCADASLNCSVELPKDEPAIAAHASITLFRIAQEGLMWAVRQPQVGRVHLSLSDDEDFMTLAIEHDGLAVTAAQRNAADGLSFWLLDNRVEALDGTLSLSGEAGNVSLKAQLPQRQLAVQHKPGTEGQAPTTA